MSPPSLFLLLCSDTRVGPATDGGVRRAPPSTFSILSISLSRNLSLHRELSLSIGSLPPDMTVFSSPPSSSTPSLGHRHELTGSSGLKASSRGSEDVRGVVASHFSGQRKCRGKLLQSYVLALVCLLQEFCISMSIGIIW